MIKVKNMVTEQNNSFEYGDFVKCVECENIMITDIGIDHCPECGKHDSMIWTEEGFTDINYINLHPTLKQKGYIIE